MNTRKITLTHGGTKLIHDHEDHKVYNPDSILEHKTVNTTFKDEKKSIEKPSFPKKHR
ncbi:hypothetical protein [uncultured Cetobacterium sp.]|uniref:hypothetical protein n=1 Tax=uncultured Cetobacterium sp. TaxID=527638 RepID=UPI0026245E91|nr:hypothetical protein [uncultured Cetobacterium sp.]